MGAVTDALLQEERTLITAHIKPDGDALGSVIAIQRGLSQLGRDSLMYLSGAEPAASEYHFLSALNEVYCGVPPDDFKERTLVAVDCGNAERIGNEELVNAAPRIINIDHHGDNSRFGDLNLVISGASSTAEILYFVLKRMGVELTGEISEALYTGILVDSGRFQYSSTSAATFKVAADLVSRIDHTAIFQHIYENMSLAKVKLQCRMLSHLVIECDGRLAIGVLKNEDFQESGATNASTEGLVDNLRAIEGVVVAALIYAFPPDQSENGKPHYRVSLRSSTDKVSVQRIANIKGGGGHVQAAGMSAEETPEELIEFLSGQVRKALNRIPEEG